MDTQYVYASFVGFILVYVIIISEIITSDPIPIPELGYLLIPILFRYQSCVFFNIIIIIIVNFI